MEPCAMDSCNCGPGRTFQTGVGCKDDPSCGDQALCLAGRGAWHPASECGPCVFYCGEPAWCDACADACDCGPHRNFTSGVGCVADPACGRPDERRVCESTGGTYVIGVCGEIRCGVGEIHDFCSGAWCDCGWSSNFETGVGCAFDASCFLEDVDERCESLDSCRAGLVCCPGDPMLDARHCSAPCCPGSQYCGEDGCFYGYD